jgi:hypothetical protein
MNNALLALFVCVTVTVKSNAQIVDTSFLSHALQGQLGWWLIAFLQ